MDAAVRYSTALLYNTTIIWHCFSCYFKNKSFGGEISFYTLNFKLLCEN